VVTSEGHVDHRRIVRSLDIGIDQEAVTAVRGWRFEPGRLGKTPVGVLVTV
jgi:TonB family protein